MKGLKSIVSVLLIGAMAFSLCACGGVKEVAPKDFKSIVKDVMDCDKEDIYESDGYADYIESYISYDGEDYNKFDITLTEYEDEEAAKFAFESTANRLEFLNKHDCVEGKMKITKNYVVYDAEIAYGYDADSEDQYGGFYLAGVYIIEVEATTGKDKDKDVVDDLLKELGYPKPSRA